MIRRDRLALVDIDRHRQVIMIGIMLVMMLSGFKVYATLTPQVHFYLQGEERCVDANGIPDHDVGDFPNAGNPNTIKAQTLHYCFPAHPVKSDQKKEIHGTVGIALNGVPIRPGTADYWDPSTSRGFSRDRSSGWNLEGGTNLAALGMDDNIAHVDPRGLYHYHGVGKNHDKSQRLLMGYAADGFSIYYDPNVRSSYVLKKGIRPSGPGGQYDGTYVQDWVYKTNSGDLDACNGKVVAGQYAYFATDTYPYFPRCVWGTPSTDFNREGRGWRF